MTEITDIEIKGTVLVVPPDIRSSHVSGAVSGRAYLAHINKAGDRWIDAIDQRDVEVWMTNSNPSKHGAMRTPVCSCGSAAKSKSPSPASASLTVLLLAMWDCAIRATLAESRATRCKSLGDEHDESSRNIWRYCSVNPDLQAPTETGHPEDGGPH